MNFQERETEAENAHRETRKWQRRYFLLTVAIFIPLMWAFVTLRNVYPMAAWTVMTGDRVLDREFSYFILRGITVSGDTVDLKAVMLTNALSNRTWSMVRAAVNNESFRLRSLHPQNAALLASYGGYEKLPPAARLPELLKVWGDIYNARLEPSAPGRLKAVRLDLYKWDGKSYSNYTQFVQSWSQEL